MLSLKKDLFIDNKVRKGTMRRTPLRNKFIVSKTDADRLAYSRQLNCSVSLIKKKKAYFINLKICVAKGNKTFWRKMKPSFLKKGKFTNKNYVSGKNECFKLP